jgi:hypothetical protein
VNWKGDQKKKKGKRNVGTTLGEKPTTNRSIVWKKKMEKLFIFSLGGPPLSVGA